MKTKHIKMSDVIVDIASGPFGSNLKVDCFVSQGVPVVDGANLRGFALTDNITKFVTQEKASSLSRSIAKRHDLVVTISGNVGQIAYIPSNSKYEKYLCSQRQFRVTLDKSKVDERYIAYYFHTSYGQKKILSFANYVGVPALSQPLPNFKNIELDIPELNEQQKIANVIETLENKIANNNAIISELEKTTKDIYDYWFMQFDFPNADGRPYRQSGGKMVWNSELEREIPEGWEVHTLGELCSFGNGINYSKNEGGDKTYRIVNVRDISSSSLLLDYGKLSEIQLPHTADRYRVNDDDILIARSGIPGAARLLPSGHTDTLYCGFIIHCLPHDRYMRLYLTYFLQALEGSNVTKDGGSILQNVSQATLKSIPAICPSRQPIDAFSRSINPLVSVVKSKMRENNELTSLRDFLLPLLMNGQAKISVRS